MRIDAQGGNKPLGGPFESHNLIVPRRLTSFPSLISYFISILYGSILFYEKKNGILGPQ